MPTRSLAAALVAVSYLGCVGCGEITDDEADVRAWIAEMQSLAEREDRRALMRHVAEHYADRRGNNRDQVESLMRGIFLRMDPIRFVVVIERLDVSEPPFADVTLTVAAASKDESWLGISADARKVSLQLEKIRKDWMLVSAEWGELGGELRW